MTHERGARMAAAVAGGVSWALLVLPPVADALEARLVTHAGLQIPLLVSAGVALGGALPARARAGFGWNERGAAGLWIAVCCGLLWMLPRSMDAALESPAAEWAKFTTLPLLVGVPLAASWPLLGAVVRGFVLANLVSMCLALGWLYHAAPMRVCNYYLRIDQLELSRFYLAVAAATSLACVLRLFLGPFPLARLLAVLAPARLRPQRIARFVGMRRSSRDHSDRSSRVCGAGSLARKLDRHETAHRRSRAAQRRAV